MELLISFLIFLVIFIALFYLIRFLPDAMLQTVAKVILIVAGLIWLISHIRPIIHALTNT